MFYSHQLLARKAPLGQIWMAATMHAKINRRKLDKLNIIKICEQILNPSVPMALRLSGILMGGVVIVYERKVKLLHDDVNRLLLEINEAWRVKPVQDPTLLPKSRNQARYEAVTLPEIAEEIEHPMFSPSVSGGHNVKLERKGFRMQLDDLEDEYVQVDPKGSIPSMQHHQADPANITLIDDLDSCMGDNDLYNRFERFDIEGDEDDIGLNFTQKENHVPTLVPSPPHEPPQEPSQEPPQEPPQQAAEEFVRDHYTEEPEEPRIEQFGIEAQGEPRTPRILARRTRKDRNFAFDDEQLMISGSTYQTWLQDTSDIVKTRGRKTKSSNRASSAKLAILMELPPTTLPSCINNVTNEVYYPAPLMNLWRNCTRERNNATSSGEKSSNHPHDPTIHSPERNFYPMDAPNSNLGGFNNEVPYSSIERQRANVQEMDGVSSLLKGFSSVGSLGTAASNQSSESGHIFLPPGPEVPLPSGGSKKRQNSSSANSFGNLDPVEEDVPLFQNLRESKLRRLSEKDPGLEFELIEETGPTQTPHLAEKHTPLDKITETIRTHLKVHFNTPGAPQSESLDQLAYGMNRKKAAQLFYQTCVLANFDYIKVHQAVSYGEIFIAKGPKM